MIKTIFYFLTILIFSSSYSQNILKPGFDINEAKESLIISSFHYPDSLRQTLNMPKLKNWEMVYSSPVVGLDNKWNLWYNKATNSCEINIRGTVEERLSWMENFYSGMIASSGEIKLDSVNTFKYKMANDTLAYVHVGWTIGVGFLSKTVLEKIDEYHKKGVKKFYISGHSQGGALALLMTSFLHYNQDLPKDIVFKTYASGAPKPGNLYFSYDFSSYTQEGWAYRIVNSRDWVPESPFSVQTISDINKINPYLGIKESTKTMKPIKRMELLALYNKMQKSLTKAQEHLTKYLGSLTYNFVHKELPYLEKLDFKNSFDYTICGNSIVLIPNINDIDSYEDKSDTFTHHHLWNYYYLFEKKYFMVKN